MTRIADSGCVTLGAVLSEASPHTNASDAYVGYFNLRGRWHLRDAIDGMQRDDRAHTPALFCGVLAA